jgi:multicomponent Na+:H+ antiporter subunit D
LPPNPALHASIAGIGLLSVAVGSLMCLRERELKRAVAFATVAHAGAALVAIAAFDAAALRDAALYVAAYGCAAAALFAAIAILRERAGSGDLRTLAGKGRRLRNTGIAFALGTLAITIVPLGSEPLARACSLVVGVATGAAFVKIFWIVFIRRTGEAAEPQSVPWFMLGPALAFGIAPLAFTVPAVRDYAARAAAGVVDATGYAAALFGNAAPSPKVPPLETLGIGIVLAPLGAVAVAWLLLTRRPAIARERRALRRGRALTGLATLHDGNASEYIGWIAATAAVAATVCTWSR